MSTIQYLDLPHDVLFLDCYVISGQNDEHIRKYLCEPLFEIASLPKGDSFSKKFSTEEEFEKFKKVALIDANYGFLVGLQADGGGHAVALFSNKDFVYFYDSNRGIVRWQKDRVDPSNNILKIKKMSQFFRANLMSYSKAYRLVSCMRFRFPRKEGAHLPEATTISLASSIITTIKGLCRQANNFAKYGMCSDKFKPVLVSKVNFVAKKVFPKLNEIAENASEVSRVESRSQLRLFLFGAAKELRKIHDDHSLDEDIFLRPIFDDFLNLGSLIVFQFYSNSTSWAPKVALYEGRQVKVYIPIKFALYNTSLKETSSADETAFTKWLKHKSNFTTKNGEKSLISVGYFKTIYKNFPRGGLKELVEYLVEYEERLNSPSGMSRKMRFRGLSVIANKLKAMLADSSSSREKKNIQAFLARIEAEWDNITSENEDFIASMRALNFDNERSGHAPSKLKDLEFQCNVWVLSVSNQLRSKFTGATNPRHVEIRRILTDANGFQQVSPFVAAFYTYVSFLACIDRNILGTAFLNSIKQVDNSDSFKKGKIKTLFTDSDSKFLVDIYFVSLLKSLSLVNIFSDSNPFLKRGDLMHIFGGKSQSFKSIEPVIQTCPLAKKMTASP